MTRVQAFYAVIRYIPSILREEFINVAVMLVCPTTDFQAVKALPSFSKSQGKLSMFDDADGQFVRHAITKLQQAASSKLFHEYVSDAPNGLLTRDGFFELFRSYHNNIRITEPKPVLTDNPEVTLEELYSTFVGVEEPVPTHARVTRDTMLNVVTTVFRQYELFSKYANRILKNAEPLPGAQKVDIYYKNDVAHFYQVIPFVDSSRASIAANSYRMLATDVRKSEKTPELAEAKFAVFGYYPRLQEHDEKIRDVIERLEDDNIELFDYENDAPKVALKIKRELDTHSGAMHVN